MKPSLRSCLSFRLAVCYLMLLSLSSGALAQKVYTIAGGYVGDGKPATSASLAFPTYAIFDPQGNLLISDGNNCRIRLINRAGTISTFAGTGICGFGGDGGKAVNAAINFPAGLALDSTGNIFFLDSGNSRLRKIDPSGTITTVAGNGTFKYCGDGGPASSACLNQPLALAVASTGSSEVLIIADTFNYRVRRIAMATGIITTIAGNGTPGYAGDGGPATAASLNLPEGIAISTSSHAIFISDSQNSAIRKVDTTTGIITTSFGNGTCGFDSQTLCIPRGIFLDKQGNLHVADALQVLEILKGSNTAIVQAGVLQEGFNGDGIPATSALLNNPWDAILDPAGNLVIVDAGNDRVRKGAGSQSIATIAGGYLGDGGPGTSAALNAPSSIAFDSGQNLYIADSWNNRIRKLPATDTISTFAGSGFTGYSGDSGPATNATLNLPGAVSADANRNIFIADSFNNVVREVDVAGTITTLTGSNVLVDPVALATDSSGNVYAGDVTCVVWKITPNGSTSIVAGNGQCGPGQDGVPATQSALNLPYGLAFDSSGNLYIADTFNNRIRIVDSQGIINTMAGNGTCGFSGDGGLATSAMLCSPFGIAVDSKHNLYIADTYNLRVRTVNTSGIIQTIAGSGSSGYNGNGLLALQTNMQPTSIVLGPTGAVYFVDAASYRVRRIH
jgi:sugar lactone lactonase YvrE